MLVIDPCSQFAAHGSQFDENISDLRVDIRDDPIRRPAPVLIPLKEVRKELTLESIIISHFSQRGLPEINFRRFKHLARLGKIIVFFDAFDEMADGVRWDVTQSNFRELSRAADNQGKVIITCRTHYFKTRTEHPVYPLTTQPPTADRLRASPYPLQPSPA